MADPQVARLHAAAKRGNVTQLDALLRAGVDPNALIQPGGDTALCEACRAGHPACVELLLAAGADHSLRGRDARNALHLAALNRSARHAECVAALLRTGADPHASAPYPYMDVLNTAASCASLEAVRLICEAMHTWVSKLRVEQCCVSLQPPCAGCW